MNSMFSTKPKIIFSGTLPIAEIREKMHPDMVWTKDPDQALLDDIADIGVEVPIILESIENQYIIRSGKRRFLACETLNIEIIPCVVKIYPLGMGARAGISTNIKRSENPVDEYHHMLQLKEALVAQDQWKSDAEFAHQLGLSISQYRKIIAVGKMAKPVQTAINEHRITINNAYQLSKLPPQRQTALIEKLEMKQRVTGRDIKEQKRVVQSDTVTALLPSLDNVRPSNLPQRDFVLTAVIKIMGPLGSFPITKEKITDFVLDMMTNPDETLEKVLNN